MKMVSTIFQLISVFRCDFSENENNMKITTQRQNFDKKEVFILLFYN